MYVRVSGDDTYVVRDAVYNSLMSPSEFDDKVEVILCRARTTVTFLM